MEILTALKDRALILVLKMILTARSEFIVDCMYSRIVYIVGVRDDFIFVYWHAWSGNLFPFNILCVALQFLLFILKCFYSPLPVYHMM